MMPHTPRQDIRVRIITDGASTSYDFCSSVTHHLTTIGLLSLLTLRLGVDDGIGKCSWRLKGRGGAQPLSALMSLE